MRDIVEVCTFNKVDVKNLAMFDLEYIFLKLRAKSVGETVNVPFICQATPECDGVHSESIDLTNVKVNTSETLDNRIQINDELIVELSPPSTKVVYSLQGKEEADMVMPLMRACLVRIYDAEEVYEMSDHRDAEIDEFVLSLRMDQFQKISEYFESLPQLKHEIEYTCHKCGGENKVTLQGLQNFF